MKYLKLIQRDGIIVILKKIFFKILVRLDLNQRINIKRYGLKLKLFNTDLTYQLFADKNYKKYEDSIYKKYLKSDDTAIDVGANIGLVTMTMAQICNNGKVISFEPSDKFYKITKQNVELNKLSNVEIHRCALGRTDGVIGFDESAKDDTTFKINKNILNNTVEIKTLDHFTKNIQQVDFLKIDVEGYETEVLLGAEDTLKKTNIIFIEFITDNQNNTKHNQDKIIDILSTNFNLYTLSKDLEEVKFEFDRNKSYKTDLLCLNKKLSNI